MLAINTKNMQKVKLLAIKNVLTNKFWKLIKINRLTSVSVCSQKIQKLQNSTIGCYLL